MFSLDELISTLNGIDLVLGIGEVKNTHPLSLLQRPHPDVVHRCSVGYTLQGNTSMMYSPQVGASSLRVV